MKIRELNEKIGDYDLKARYDDFNRLYWDGRLPEIPLKWGKIKNAGGVALAKVRRRAGSVINPRNRNQGAELIPGSLGIKISDTLMRSPEAIDGILLHEMVHIALYVSGNFYPPDGAHGAYFLNELRRVEKLAGRSIPLTDHTTVADELNPDIKLKPVVVVVRYGNYNQDGPPRGFTITTEKYIDVMKNHITSTIQHYAVFIMESPLWNKVKTKLPVKRIDQKKIFPYWPFDVMEKHFPGALAEIEQSKPIWDNQEIVDMSRKS